MTHCIKYRNDFIDIIIFINFSVRNYAVIETNKRIYKAIQKIKLNKKERDSDTKCSN